MKDSVFKLFQTLHVKEEILDLNELLNKKGIETKLVNSSLGITGGAEALGASAVVTYALHIKEDDFKIANKLLEEEAIKQVDSISKDHYLYDFTDEELYDILQNQNEWNHLDYALAKKILKEKITIINADTLFHKKILEDLIISPYDAALAIDDTISSPLPEEAMKATIENKKIKDVSKTIPAEKTQGDAIGLYKFAGESLKILISELDNLVLNSITKQLFTYAVRNILDKTDVYSVSTKGRAWIEIDDKNDLDAAQKLIDKIISI